MFVVTLIAAPTGNGIPPRTRERIIEGLRPGVSASVWLHENYALDIFIESEPDDAIRHQLKREASVEGVDWLMQKADNRRKKILVADMDSTMIKQECIDELAAEIGIKERVSAITARAMNGEIAFEPALRERVALLEGLPENVIDKVLAERIELAPGAMTLIATMRASGAYTALVSGGFTVFTTAIAKQIGFHEHHANQLMVENGRFTGRVAEPILGSLAKVKTLRELSERRRMSTSDAIAVGDGANDLEMLGLAGTGIALHAKPNVAAAAPHRIDYGDLTSLLFAQGYKWSEFVT